MPKVILSTNQNPDYYFYLPITAAVWKHVLDFDTIAFVVGKSELSELVTKTTLNNPYTYKSAQIQRVAEISGFKSETVSQVSRFFGACVEQDEAEYLIIGDVDMIPLNSYLYRDFDKMNLFGKDLTGGHQYPMCYVGMQVEKWKEFLGLTYGEPETQLKELLESLPKAKAEKWEEYWDTDQDFLTKKVKEFGEEKFQKIDRGFDKHLAAKRIDRADWRWNVEGDYIDSHMLRPSYKPENFERTMELLEQKLGMETDWMRDYHKEFLELITP